MDKDKSGLSLYLILNIFPPKASILEDVGNCKKS